MMIGQRRAQGRLNSGKNERAVIPAWREKRREKMGRYCCNLTILANDHQLKQISKTINEDRQNTTSDLGFGLLTFLQLTNQTNRGSEGSEMTTQCESTQSWGGGGGLSVHPQNRKKDPASPACVTCDVRYMV